MTVNIEKRFWQFHHDNPGVYELFKQFAFEARKAGFDHYGAKAIFERVRWHIHITTNDREFKLNNNYHSRYARLMARDYPQMDGFFRNRKLKTTTALELNFL